MEKLNFDLLKTMCALHAPSGNEVGMKDFLLNHIKKEKENWKYKPTIYAGDDFQDCIVLVFGKPRAAVFAHIDSIGFTVRYNNQLVKIGGPRTDNGFHFAAPKCGRGQELCALASASIPMASRCFPHASNFIFTLQPGDGICDGVGKGTCPVAKLAFRLLAVEDIVANQVVDGKAGHARGFFSDFFTQVGQLSHKLCGACR